MTVRIIAMGINSSNTNRAERYFRKITGTMAMGIKITKCQCDRYNIISFIAMNLYSRTGRLQCLLHTQITGARALLLRRPWTDQKELALGTALQLLRLTWGSILIVLTKDIVLIGIPRHLGCP